MKTSPALTPTLTTRGPSPAGREPAYLAALSSLKISPSSRAFYDHKRAQGKSHEHALIALARRRTNVIWAILRDNTLYAEPVTTLPLTT